MKSGIEAWHLTVSLGAATEARFAIFYRVAGTEFWDNNFWRDYRITPAVNAEWGLAP